jgi:hypothetical protein
MYIVVVQGLNLLNVRGREYHGMMTWLVGGWFGLFLLGSTWGIISVFLQHH